jgi:hypothetical protein
VAREIVGIVERVEITGNETVRTMAVFDTGARMTSVDVRLAAKAQLGPIVKTTKISNPSHKGKMRRPVVKARIRIKGRDFDALVNIQDREHMAFPVIIGRNIITENFMVDTRKNIGLHEKTLKEKNDKGKQAKV